MSIVNSSRRPAERICGKLRSRFTGALSIRGCAPGSRAILETRTDEADRGDDSYKGAEIFSSSGYPKAPAIARVRAKACGLPDLKVESVRSPEGGIPRPGVHLESKPSAAKSFVCVAGVRK